MRVFLSLLFFCLLTFVGGIAYAQPDELSGVGSTLLEAIRGGHYAYAAAIGLVAIVSLLRTYGGSHWPWLSHKLVAPLLVLVGSFGATVTASLAEGAALSGGMLWGAAKLAVTGAGLYSLAKPYMNALTEKYPALGPFASFINLLFQPSKKARDAKVARAVDDALKNHQPKGTEIKFTDVE